MTVSQPTLTLGTTVLALDHVDADATTERTYDERSVSRRTIGGRLRTTILSWGHIYRIGFRYASRDAYDAIVALWQAAVDAGAYPTFTWAGGPWASAESGVTVAVEISAMRSPYPDLAACDFDLTLTEDTPR